jgi:hypothetical protein
MLHSAAAHATKSGACYDGNGTRVTIARIVVEPGGDANRFAVAYEVTVVLGKSGGFQVFGPRNKPGEKGSGSPDLPAHHQDFLDCVRSGSRPHADVEEGHLSAVLVHLGNIACRVGRTLNVDPAGETIAGDDEANKLVRRAYREGHWAVPKGV